jgi:hypothetical protein
MEGERKGRKEVTGRTETGVLYCRLAHESLVCFIGANCALSAW